MASASRRLSGARASATTPRHRPPRRRPTSDSSLTAPAPPARSWNGTARARTRCTSGETSAAAPPSEVDVSVGCAAGRGDLARLEQAEGALAHVGELVGDDRVEAVLGQGELDEAALGRLEVQRLRAALVGTGPEQVLALLVHGVEHRADDVEGGVLRRAGVEDPGPDLLAGLDPDRGVAVLVDVAVEHHGVPVRVL